MQLRKYYLEEECSKRFKPSSKFPDLYSFNKFLEILSPDELSSLLDKLEEDGNDNDRKADKGT